MNKKYYYAAMFVLLFTILLCSCGIKSTVSDISDSSLNVADSTTDHADSAVSNAEADKKDKELSDEQALTAIIDYCYSVNPNLETVVKDGEYPVYWDIFSSSEEEIVVLFRSYTGAQNRYYIDRFTGDTYVTEYVPGITQEWQKLNESFNIRGFYSEN